MKRMIIATLLLCCYQSTFAAGIIPDDDDDFIAGSAMPAGSWFAGFGFGADFTDLDDSTSVKRMPASIPPDKFLVKKQAEVGTVNLLFGYQGSHNRRFFPVYSFFVGYTYSVPGKIHGDVEEFSDPTKVNYSYEYEVSRQTLQFFGKFDLCEMGRFMPFIIGGLGGSYNRADDYSETAKPGVTPRNSPGFGDDNEFVFAYSFGGGFDFKAYDNIWLSLGYLYGDFGDVQTGKGVATFSTDRLKTEYKAHTIVFNAMYFFHR